VQVERIAAAQPVEADARDPRHGTAGERFDDRARRFETERGELAPGESQAGDRIGQRGAGALRQQCNGVARCDRLRDEQRGRAVEQRRIVDDQQQLPACCEVGDRPSRRHEHRQHVERRRERRQVRGDGAEGDLVRRGRRLHPGDGDVAGGGLARDLTCEMGLADPRRPG
jgi:hypothetical protein